MLLRPPLTWSAKRIEFTGGYTCIRLNWEQFLAFVKENSNLRAISSGGSREAHGRSLQLSCEIFESRHPGALPGSTELNGQLRRFRLAIRGRINLTDRELASGFEVWAIGQHHGLATPLLDWTASPLVASFFAYSESRAVPFREDLDETALKIQVENFEKDRDEGRSVFALDARRVNTVFYTRLQEELRKVNSRLPDKLTELSSSEDNDDPEDGFSLAEQIAEQLFPADLPTYAQCREAVLATELEVPRVIAPLSGENRRLVNQRGLFTKLAKPLALDDWVKRFFSVTTGVDSSHGLSDEQILLKIDLPNGRRLEALKWLDAANINYLSLFPDLYGATQFSNTRI